MKQAVELLAPPPRIFSPVRKEQKQGSCDKASPLTGLWKWSDSDSRQELVDPIVRMTARNDFISMISSFSGVQTVRVLPSSRGSLNREALVRPLFQNLTIAKYEPLGQKTEEIERAYS